jgi:hypothetical protein
LAAESKLYQGEAKLWIKTVRRKDPITKGASVIGAGLIGYGLAGADAVSVTQMKGTLTITDRAIYFAGNIFPFERILTIEEGSGHKPAFICNTIDPFIHQEVEIDSKDKDRIRKAIEKARTPQF